MIHVIVCASIAIIEFICFCYVTSTAYLLNSGINGSPVVNAWACLLGALLALRAAIFLRKKSLVGDEIDEWYPESIMLSQADQLIGATSRNVLFTYYVLVMILSVITMSTYGTIHSDVLQEQRGAAWAASGWFVLALFRVISLYKTLCVVSPSPKESQEETQDTNSTPVQPGVSTRIARNCTCCCDWTFRITILVIMILFTVQSVAVESDIRLFEDPTMNLTMVPFQAQNGIGNLLFRCTGSKVNASEPTIFLHHGGGASFSDWIGVQDELATRGHRVCSHDRAGQGFSSPGSYPETIDTPVNYLIEALELLGEPGPFLCAGHSAGGTVCRAWHRAQPSQVVGMVMLDAYCNYGDCDIELEWYLEQEGNDGIDRVTALELLTADKKSRLGGVDMIRWMSPLFLVRLFAGVSENYKPQNRAVYQQAKFGSNVFWESQYVGFSSTFEDGTYSQVDVDMWKLPGSIDIPLLVVGAGVNDTCSQSDIPEDSVWCKTTLSNRIAARTQLSVYAATSTKGETKYCSNGCTHGFISERIVETVGYIEYVLFYT